MEHSTTVLFGSDSRIARQFSATSTASSSSESHDEHVRKFIPRVRIRSINDYLCVIISRINAAGAANGFEAPGASEEGRNVTSSLISEDVDPPL